MKCKVKEFREKLKMTQSELAEKANVSRTTISGLENGRIKVTTTDTLVKLSSALKKNVSEIFFLKNV